MGIDLILQILKELGEMTAEVFFTNYYNSYRNMYRRLYGKERSVSKKYFNQDRHKFYNLLFYLRKQGFVKREERLNKKPSWVLTRAGIVKLNKLKEKRSGLKFTEKRDKKDFLKIIVFDIPEKEKLKRAWLRSQLTILDFKMLQKSVWIGNSKLPEEFLKDLDDLGISRYIHIFGITKSGTLGMPDFKID